MENELTAAHRIYKRLWSKTVAQLKSDGLRIDSLLRNKAGDARRGVTLVAWPDAGVRRRVNTFLREAAVICPGQHFYKPAQLHLTVLAIIPGSESWREQIHRLPACQAVLDKVLKNRRAFSVKFRGLTASPDAVMIQGFPTDDTLAALRDKLRDAFRQHGLDENLDRRYKISTAHLTAMRFSDPKADWKDLLSLLEAHRETDFGSTRFQSLQLIWSDWYASTGVVRVLQKYRLND
jgi:2'-5' RNA ligase